MRIPRGPAIAFLAGVALGINIGFHARLSSTELRRITLLEEVGAENRMKECKVCKEDEFWHVREPVQFLGPFANPWLEQYET